MGLKGRVFNGYHLKKLLVTYSFIFPFLVFIVIFSFIPIVQLFFYSFRSGSILGKMPFAGFANYIRLFSTKNYLAGFVTSLVLVIFSIPITQIIAFTLAILLKRKIHLASAFFETVYFLPLLVSMVGAGVVMSYLFSPNAPINYLIQLTGLKPVNWLGTPAGARTVIVVIETWKDIGFYVFVYLTAIRVIPEDYYEVAKIEGANIFQVLFRITIPLLQRTIFYCLTMVFIWQSQIFDSAYITTRGGPFNTTKTVVYNIYETTFLLNRPGLGSSIAVFFLAVILAITAIQNYFSGKLDVLEY
jgi:ABC-type sugar transport system permease subunit